MDPQKVQELVSLKMSNIYPPNSTKSERYILKRRAESYQVIGKANHTAALYPLHYNILKCMLKCLWKCFPNTSARGRKTNINMALQRLFAPHRRPIIIFVEFHASAIGAHCGIEKTMHAILQRFYCPEIGRAHV